MVPTKLSGIPLYFVATEFQQSLKLRPNPLMPLALFHKLLLPVANAREDEKRLCGVKPLVPMMGVTYNATNDGPPPFATAAYDKGMKWLIPLREFVLLNCRRCSSSRFGLL